MCFQQPGLCLVKVVSHITNQRVLEIYPLSACVRRCKSQFSFTHSLCGVRSRKGRSPTMHLRCRRPRGRPRRLCPSRGSTARSGGDPPPRIARCATPHAPAVRYEMSWLENIHDIGWGAECPQSTLPSSAGTRCCLPANALLVCATSPDDVLGLLCLTIGTDGVMSADNASTTPDRVTIPVIQALGDCLFSSWCGQVSGAVRFLMRSGGSAGF